MNARSRRLLGLLAALLPPTLGAWAGLAPEALPPPTRAGLALPEQVGPWRLSRERPLDDAVWRQIRPDFHTFRLYEAVGRNPVAVYVGLYRGRAAREAAHDPRICYPAQGWEILAEDTLHLELPGERERLRATALHLELDGTDREALYWFQPAGRWPGPYLSEQLRQIASGLLGSPQYAFVRLETMESAAVETDPMADLRDFAARLAHPVRAAVEALPDATGPPEATRIASQP